MENSGERKVETSSVVTESIVMNPRISCPKIAVPLPGRKLVDDGEKNRPSSFQPYQNQNHGHIQQQFQQQQQHQFLETP
jgi:hypothetical protein